MRRERSVRTDMNGKKHLFLTGQRQVGKSTLIRRLLERESRKLGGFYTVKTDRVFPGAHSVHMIRLESAEEPSVENMLFLCDAPWGEEAAERFNELGCRAMRESRRAELLIMDELGPREARANAFLASVQEALDGDVPILGVLQKADAEHIERTARHFRVQVAEVTAANRNDLVFWKNLWNGLAQEPRRESSSLFIW